MYNHCQKSKLHVYILAGISLLFSILLIITNLNPILVTSYIFVFFVIRSFSELCVSVEGVYLKIRFKYWIFSKKFLLSDIQSAKKVRNKCYHGWGIRWKFAPFTPIFNVYWLDAIELIMRNNKRYRIGTDDVDNLFETVNNKIK